MGMEEFVAAVLELDIIRGYFKESAAVKSFGPKEALSLIERRQKLKEFPRYYRLYGEEFEILEKIVANAYGDGYLEGSEKKEQIGKSSVGKKSPLERTESQPGDEPAKQPTIRKRPIAEWAAKESFQPVTLQDLDTYYLSSGIVGERNVRTLLVYGALARAHLGIESFSGSGKSALLHSFLELLPQREIYTLQQGSDKFFLSDKNINDYSFLVIEELQKLDSLAFKELIKTLTEGKEATYTRSNRQHDGVERIIISPDKSIIYTLATSNTYFKHKDEELNRRFIVFYTDISKEQNEEIIRSYASRQMEDPPKQKNEKDEVKLRLKRHIESCLEVEYFFVNPLLPYLVEHFPEEIKSNVRVRSFVRHFNSLVQGCTLFHYPQNLSAEGGLFASLQTNQQVCEQYGGFFYDNILGISVVERAILSRLNMGQKYTVEDIFTDFQTNYCTSKLNLIRSSLDNLYELGFIEKNEKKIVRIREDRRLQMIDWSEAFDYAARLMKDKYSRISAKWEEISRKGLDGQKTAGG